MARSLWTGSISFGLVNVPVKVFSATHDHSVHFHQLQKRTGARIEHKKVSARTGREVAADNIVLGFELSEGHHVEVDPDELDALRPKTTKTIDVQDFVALADIDPVYYQKTYWLAPDGEAAERAYRLLAAAMEAEERVAIGTVVMRRKQYLAAIRPVDAALALSTMRFADEVVPGNDVDGIPSRRTKPPAKELELARSLIDSLATDFDPGRYRDTYTDDLKEMIRQRAEGKEVVVEEAAAASADVVDLMAALEASVEEAKGKRRRAKPAAGSSKRRRSA